MHQCFHLSGSPELGCGCRTSREPLSRRTQVFPSCAYCASGQRFVGAPKNEARGFVLVYGQGLGQRLALGEETPECYL